MKISDTYPIYINDIQCFFCDGTSRYGVPENLRKMKKWSRKMRLLSVFYFSFEISIACWLLSRPNLRIVSKLTTDVVTYRYCTEASNQKSKYAYQKIFFYKKSTDDIYRRYILSQPCSGPSNSSTCTKWCAQRNFPEFLK